MSPNLGLITMPKSAKPLAQPLLQATLVWNFSIDILKATIHHFIYGPANTLQINIAKYDYIMSIIESVAFQQDAE
ncbi:hypothetical protein KY284_010801 [Solanum tuberosum]|nr:hypothetical protein KY284_010801 [Solanum tuberosum]